MRDNVNRESRDRKQRECVLGGEGAERESGAAWHWRRILQEPNQYHILCPEPPTHFYYGNRNFCCVRLFCCVTCDLLRYSPFSAVQCRSHAIASGPICSLVHEPCWAGISLLPPPVPTHIRDRGRLVEGRHAHRNTHSQVPVVAAPHLPLVLWTLRIPSPAPLAKCRCCTKYAKWCLSCTPMQRHCRF